MVSLMAAALRASTDDNTLSGSDHIMSKLSFYVESLVRVLRVVNHSMYEFLGDVLVYLSFNVDCVKGYFLILFLN